MRLRIVGVAVAAVALAMLVGICGSSAQAGEEEKNVLCTTFPIYQITRNVTKGRDGVSVELMLPSQLGCPHDYALTPQDMQKLARAHVLVVNGLGMEEFLGAPLKKANANLVIIDSSEGIKETLEYTGGHEHDDHGHHEEEEHQHEGEHGHDHGDEHHHHGEAAYEWAGAFKLEAGTYRWTFAKTGGEYADPAMKVLVLASEGKEPIEHVEGKAKHTFEGKAEELDAGGTIPVGQMKHLHFDSKKNVTSFSVKIAKPGVYVFFCEHFPYEFEADEHFFKTSDGKDVEPVAEEPEAEHDHAHHGHGHHGHGHHDHHGEHGHHHHHEGANPHLFASPRMAAKLAMNIAAGLSKTDPAGAAVYFKNAQAYAETLNKLAEEMADLGKRLRNNRIVQPHGIFDYLARDMGLEIVAVMQAHGQEPSAAEMVELVKTIREKKVGAIFTEPQYPEKAGRTLAKETGVKVGMLDPVASGPEDAPLDYYESEMRKNMKTLEEILGVK